MISPVDKITYTKNAKLLNGRILLLDSLDIVGNLASNLGRRVGLKELAKLLLLIIIVWWVTGVVGVSLVILALQSLLSHLNGAWAALEPVRDKDLVLLMSVAESENISSLKSLFKVAKDVVDYDNGLFRIDGASDIWWC